MADFGIYTKNADIQARAGANANATAKLTAATDVTEIFPGDYVQISNTDAGRVEEWDKTTNDLRYARYWGKEAGVFSRAAGTPFAELLSTGVIPDESLLSDDIGWFQLMEASA